MKILCIRGKNLASLEGEFEVNFTTEPLRSAGIFAITGHTGAGKSTLLDALCLALFDRTPRSNGASENVSLSDVNDQVIRQGDSRTLLRRGTSDGFAEAEFLALSGEHYRSRWSVRRARDRVEGSLQNVELRLFNCSQQQEVSGRKTELLAKVSELIGLTFEQFTRSVLLAQGDFATFLKSGSGEKAELLEKLTGTEVYSRISRAIYEQSKIADRELEKIQLQLSNLALFSKEECEHYKEEISILADRNQKLQAQQALLEAKRRWWHQLKQRTAEVEEIQEVLTAAERKKHEAAPRILELQLHERVQEVRELYFNVQKDGKSLTEKQQRIVLLAQEIAGQQERLLLLQSNQLATQQEAEKLQGQYHALQPVLIAARELDGQLNSEKALLAQSAKEHLEIIKVQQHALILLEKTNKEREELVARKVKIENWIKQHEAYRNVGERLDFVLIIFEDASNAKNAIQKSKNTLLELERLMASETLQQAMLKKEEERLNLLLPAEIATLRARLQFQQPCPVCGSIEHPYQGIAADTLAEEELTKARQTVTLQLEQLHQRLEQHSNDKIQLTSYIDRYEEQLNNAMEKLNDVLQVFGLWQTLRSMEDWRSHLKQIGEYWQKAVEELRRNAENQAINNGVCQQQQENLNTLTLRLRQMEERKGLQEKTLRQIQEQRNALLEGKGANEVEMEFRQSADANALRQKKVSESLQQAEAEKARNSGVMEQLHQEVQELKQINATGCDKLNQWLSATDDHLTMETLQLLFEKEPSWIREEREALQQIADQLAISKTRLMERQLNLSRLLEAEERPLQEESLERIEEQLNLCDVERKQANGRMAEVAVLLAHDEEKRNRVAALSGELNQKTDSCENWKKLNDLLGSADGAKFKKLAQGYTLESLITYANLHLRDLSGRYELKRIPDTLALQVVDLDMMNDIRSVHSLSGGESFLISLALALGLSSLSSNRMKVESLFIDEGFGSLDPETLRLAMDALERLQTSGRKIGVISHVAEMTERIATQIRVIKTMNGRSRIEIF